MGILPDVSRIIREGSLAEALATIKEQIRKFPSNSGFRVALYELSAIAGDWDRAESQLGVAAGMGCEELAVTHGPMVGAAREREAFFAGTGSPPALIGGEDPWVEEFAAAVAAHAGGSPEALVALEAKFGEEKALHAGTAGDGTAADVAFAAFRNADSRLFPVFELATIDGYRWVPLSQIVTVRLSPEPKHLRDLVWFPASVVTKDRESHVGYTFPRYPGSHASDNEKVRFAAATEWDDDTEDLDLALGMTVFLTDVKPIPLLDPDEIRFGVAAAAETGSEEE